MKKSKLTENVIEGVFGENTACCFIVKKRHKKAFITALARKLIGEGCRQFDFYGKYAQKWEDIFIDTEIELKRDLNKDNVSLFMAWDNKRDFWTAVGCIKKEKVHFFYDEVLLK